MGNGGSVAMAESRVVAEQAPAKSHPEIQEETKLEQGSHVKETAQEISTGGETAETEETSIVRRITVDDVKTAPPDWRFPTTNQAKHCFTRYNEYHKCMKDKGEGASECDKYRKYYYSLCPLEWIERWDEQRANGSFAGRY